MESVANAIRSLYNGEATQRVIYSESHDEVANGKARVPQEADEKNPQSRVAQKLSTLAASLVMTSPGIPMLFQGQEFLQDKWFEDTSPLDWDLADSHHGIVLLYRDLIRLRLNRRNETSGLTGNYVQVHHVNDEIKLIAFHRWQNGGPGDDVLVVVNFSNQTRENYSIGFPREGLWKLRFNSDAQVYSSEFGGFFSGDALATATERDGYPFQGVIHIAPYSTLIFSQDPG